MRTIHVIPWNCDAFAALTRLVHTIDASAAAAGDLSDFLCVFPHHRPARYLRRSLFLDPELPKPCRPPEMAASAQLFSRLRIRLENGPLAHAPHHIAGRLDRVEALMQCIRALPQKDGAPLAGLPLHDPTLFIPWGLRLEALYEECARQSVTPKNILYTEEHVQDFAARLLEQLGDIGEAYDALLLERGWTTPARDAFLVAQNSQAACEALDGKKVIIAGFHAMSAVEEKLFHELWRQGAAMVLHSDPALAANAPVHWSCKDHETLLRTWGARAELLCPGGETAGNAPPSIRYFEGFDLHSQLDNLQRELRALAADNQRDIAVVLPNTNLLLPTLHHLPEPEAANVTMGYPLERSPLSRLVDCILRLQENARQDAGYYWRDLVECIRHPYLKMLTLPADVAQSAPSGGEAGLRSAFHALENAVRSGQAYMNPMLWEPVEEHGGWRTLAGDARPEDVRRLFREVLEACLDRWREVRSLAQAAEALQHLCDLLRTCGAPLWKRFPIDAECLHRLLYNVIPALGQSSLAREPLPRETVFAVLRQEMQDERVPFEAEDAAGLQLLGLMETRLLPLETVVVLDATDDALPGPPGNDPLLPDGLRRLIGLPDSQQRERALAHIFFRLLHGARNVVLMYQSSMESGSLWDEKRLRSRFVEELIWRYEQKAGRVVRPGEPPVMSVCYPVSAPRPCRRSIAKSPAIRASLDQLLHKGLSPSSLDAYLSCPAKFYYERICRLKPAQEVVEDGDPLEIGELVHLVLEEYFRDRLGAPLHGGNLDQDALTALYLERLRQREFFNRIPYDQRLLLEKTGPILLRDYLAHLPPTTVLALETPLQGRLDVQGQSVRLCGKADRVDQRDEGHVVLDYKTGSLRPPGSGFWKTAPLWERMRHWPDCEEPSSLLANVATGLQSVQLPLYCLLYKQQTNILPGNAALVELRNKGRERPLFGKTIEEEERDAIIQEQLPALLEFLVRHMLECPAFAPREDKHCRWCDYAACCVGAAAESIT